MTAQKDFRLCVFKDFEKAEILTKLPENMSYDQGEHPVAPGVADDKKSDESKALLAKNAKLFFDPKVDTALLEAALAALSELGLKEIAENARLPKTSTGIFFPFNFLLLLQIHWRGLLHFFF